DVDDLPGADDSLTVGGLLATALGRVPIPGATVTVGGLRLSAERAAGRRNQIGTVVVQRLPHPSNGDDGSPPPRSDDGGEPVRSSSSDRKVNS
ncbi:transporter associated domain-containing protein, partial [Frankia casuarinae]